MSVKIGRLVVTLAVGSMITACSQTGTLSSKVLAEQAVEACSQFRLEIENTGTADALRAGFDFHKKVRKREDLWTVYVIGNDNGAVACIDKNIGGNAPVNIAIQVP